MANIPTSTHTLVINKKETLSSFPKERVFVSECKLGDLLVFHSFADEEYYSIYILIEIINENFMNNTTLKLLNSTGTMSMMKTNLHNQVYRLELL